MTLTLEDGKKVNVRKVIGVLKRKRNGNYILQFDVGPLEKQLGYPKTDKPIWLYLPV